MATVFPVKGLPILVSTVNAFAEQIQLVQITATFVWKACVCVVLRLAVQATATVVWRACARAVTIQAAHTTVTAACVDNVFVVSA